MRLRVVVRGRVQGVGFRWFVRERAMELDLAGWVMNRIDGAVELEVDGDAAAIARLREILAVGPRGAVVSSVEELDHSADRLTRPFTISR